MEEFMHIDDENNEKFLQEILNDVNEVLETMQTPENTEDESDHTIAEACTPFPKPPKDNVKFCRFEDMYSTKNSWK